MLSQPQSQPEEFRRAMRQWATGVTIVAAEHMGARHGMTVSAFTSLSLHPPLVLVSLERGTRTHELVAESGHFSVSILALDQWAISDRFAGRHTEHQDRFAGLETFTLVSGAPFLAGGLAYFDCRMVSSYEAGTHTIYIGDVLAVKYMEGGQPLLYFNQAYRGLGNGPQPTLP